MYVINFVIQLQSVIIEYRHDWHSIILALNKRTVVN